MPWHPTFRPGCSAHTGIASCVSEYLRSQLTILLVESTQECARWGTYTEEPRLLTGNSHLTAQASVTLRNGAEGGTNAFLAFAVRNHKAAQHLHIHRDQFLQL